MIKVSALTRMISDHQLDVQERLIDSQVEKVNADLAVTAPFAAQPLLRLKEELLVLRKSVQTAREEAHQVPVAYPWPFWTKLLFKIYLWSVHDRFK